MSAELRAACSVCGVPIDEHPDTDACAIASEVDASWVPDDLPRGSALAAVNELVRWYPDEAIGKMLSADIRALLDERDAAIRRAEEAERLNALLPDELTRLADRLEDKVPVPSNRMYYEEGWLDAIRAVQDELRFMRAALRSQESQKPPETER